MSKTVLDNHRINTGIIVALVLLFIAVIYLPKSIWDYEDQLRDESRFRMHTSNGAEKLHYMVAQTYTTDTEQLVALVNAVRDSLRAAQNDTGYSYFGQKSFIAPGRSYNVDYTAEYLEYYNQQHLALFKSLDPNHSADAATVATLLDSIKVLFDTGNYTGAKTMVLDSTSLSFTVSDKYDILYQNIKTYMFNALTNSFTKYPEFSNPLVDAVMDSLEKNPGLIGRTDFVNVYDGSVRVDFIIPSSFEANLVKTKKPLEKAFLFQYSDSLLFGDTLYDMAMDEFFTRIDTLDEVPAALTLQYTDTSGTALEIPVEVMVEDMEALIAKRRNTLYTMLTGYAEPNPYIAEQVINRALDSLSSPNVGFDSLHMDIDLSEVVFNINIHTSIGEYFNKVGLEQAYYKSKVNLTDLDWTNAAVEVVEFVASELKHDQDFTNWQIVDAEADTFFVNIPNNFLRRFDDMNMRLFQKLTGEFSNRHDLVHYVISQAQDSASVDSLDFSGQRVIHFAADTLEFVVPLNFLGEYETTFLIPRDTVVQIDDSTFNGVWARNKMAVTQEFSMDSLNFLSPGEMERYRYDFSGTDSVLAINILERSDTSRVELVFYDMETYVMIFGEDSLMENLYLITGEYAELDSIQIDTLSVVSEAFVADSKEKDLFMSKDSFGGWVDTLINRKYVKKQLFTNYELTPELTHCSVTGLPFRITVRNNVNLAIESPIAQPIETRRYLFFSQVDSSHGSIDDGEFSWVK